MASEAFRHAEAPLRSETLSLSDVEMLERVYDSGTTGLHLKGYDIRRSRERMLPMGMVEQGRLGERYVVISPKGKALIERIRSSRG